MTPHATYWAEFKKTDEYKKLSDTMMQNGMKQPYVDNILYRTFDYGFNSRFEFYKPFVMWVVRKYPKGLKRSDISEWLKDWIKKEFGIK
jgi:hypothetical protein